jgi:hypothetical protein
MKPSVMQKRKFFIDLKKRKPAAGGQKAGYWSRSNFIVMACHKWHNLSPSEVIPA